jgi:hypothetical protein
MDAVTYRGKYAVAACLVLASCQRSSKPAFTEVYQQYGQQTLYCQRSDGSVAILGTHKAAPGYVTRRVIFANGLDVEVAALLKLKTSQQASAEQLAKRKAKPPWDRNRQCTTQVGSGEAQWKVIGRETIFGVQTFKVQYAGIGVTPTEWRAPALDCREVKRLYDDGSTLDQKIPVSLTIGEPAARYFEVPPDYGEVAPSVMNTKWGEHFGVKPSEATVRQWQAIMDRGYNEAKKNPPLW